MIGGLRSALGSIHWRNAVAALEYLRANDARWMRDWVREATIWRRNGVARGEFSLDEKVRVNGNKPISSLSDVAEPHCMSVMEYPRETVPVIRGYRP